jgi:PHD/YefM family antitoxin component YafN of YafNO toxin-antitoxin module
MAINEDDLQEYALKDFRQNLSQIIGEVVHTQKRIKVTSYGKVAGYFIHAEDMAYLEAMEEREDLEAAKAYKAKGDDQPLTPLSQVKRELGL